MNWGALFKSFLLASGVCSLAWAQVPPPNVPPGSPLPPADAPPVDEPTNPDASEPPGASAGEPVAPAVEPLPAPPIASEPAPALAPVIIPPVQPAFPPGSMDAPPDEKRALPPPETTLALELDIGAGTRLGGSGDFDLNRDQSGGVTFGPSLWLSLSRLWSAGLAYERSMLGGDRSNAGANTIDVTRALDAVWLRGRAYPWRTNDFGLYVGLGLGASWQRVRSTGTRASDDFVRPSAPYSCSATDGPGFALGGGLGLDLDMSRSVAFVTGVDAAAHRQTGDVVDGCAPGSGSITSIGARIGFAYRFDLDQAPSPSSSARVGYAR